MVKTVLNAFILLLVLALTPSLNSQKANDTKPCNQDWTSVRDLFKPRDGWDIGFIDASKVLSEESALKVPDPVFSGVTSVQLGLKSREFYFPDIQFRGCSREAVIVESSMVVDRVVAFKKNGRVFAYKLFGGIRNLEDGVWQARMAHANILVYDPDGSGKFNDIILYSPEIPYLPKWVKRDVSAK